MEVRAMGVSVRIDRVSKSFGKKQVLKDINLEIEEGMIYGFIGPSGAGKTTLVKLIVGIHEPDTGTITVLNKKVPDMDLFRDIGYMAQSDALYHDLTGLENLKFFASLYNLSKKEQKERIEYAAGLVKLNDDLKRRVSVYSGGMKRRLSLAIALIQDPKILILDEPTVGIDPELRVGVWNELKRLRDEEGKTILITTHVMDEAEKCDYIGMVRDGTIIARGTPAELKERYGAESLDEVFLKAGRSDK